MKKTELFEQLYRAEKSRGYFCIAEDGKILWANEKACEMLPMLAEGQSAEAVLPGFDPMRLMPDSVMRLAGGESVRLSRFTDEEAGESFTLAELMAGQGEIPEYTVLLMAQMRDKLSRIRSLIGESKNSLCDIQADYSGTVPRLAGELDHQIGWINGAEKDCDALTRYLMQFEENFAGADRRADGNTDLGKFLPLLFRDAELALKEDGVPLELICDWNGVDSGCWVGCSEGQISMALLGMIRIAAVSALQKEGGSLFVQGKPDKNGSFLLWIKDSGTDAEQLEAYEPLTPRSGQKIPMPANFAAGRMKQLLDAVGGSWMLGRAPGESGYLMQMRFPMTQEIPERLESSVAYRLEGLDYGMDGRWPAGLSGKKDLIRIMFSRLEDDMR